MNGVYRITIRDEFSIVKAESTCEFASATEAAAYMRHVNWRKSAGYRVFALWAGPGFGERMAALEREVSA